MRLPSLLLLAFAVGHCKDAGPKLIGSHSTPETAFQLEADKTLSGAFGGDNSGIFIRVELKEAAMFRAELSAARGVDSSLTVFHPPDKPLVTVDDNASSAGEEISPLYLPGGVSLIRITAKRAELSPFTFFYRVFHPPADIEREPNQLLENATRIEALHATGFYGPEFALNGKDKLAERDCFYKELQGGKALVTAQLTGVDGVIGSVGFFDGKGKPLTRQDAVDDRGKMTVGPVAVPEAAKFFICVAAARRTGKTSRDYYDLTLTVAEFSQKTEIEPNETPQAATPITHEYIDGAITTFADKDYYLYHNRRDYPIILRAELKAEKAGGLALWVAKKSEADQLYQDSAALPVGSQRLFEVAENIRLESGEQLVLAVKNRIKLVKKNFKPASYTLKIQETQFSDEHETENNNVPEKADTLVDLTYKSGFINPVGDADYYRIKTAATIERTLFLDSKIACLLRIEHLRAGKTVAAATGNQAIKYQARFENDDLVKLQCLGQKINPPERAYRLTLIE